METSTEGEGLASLGDVDMALRLRAVVEARVPLVLAAMFLRPGSDCQTGGATLLPLQGIARIERNHRQLRVEARVGRTLCDKLPQPLDVTCGVTSPA